jgi:peroxiredoxin Q/BCP
MTVMLQVGDLIPSFKLKDAEGLEFTDEDFIGAPLVLYFYPRDDTPGCTKEACSFRDNLSKLDALDVIVVGVSPDSQESHEKFIEKHNLNFTLFADTTLELCKTFGVIQETIKDGKSAPHFERTTFLIDYDGTIRWIERPVKVEGHVERVIEAVNALER